MNTWKEIADYLGKGVRTVQRWERELALPVHRIHTDAGEIVYALATEIEQWLREREERGDGKSGNRQISAQTPEQRPLGEATKAPARWIINVWVRWAVAAGGVGLASVSLLLWVQAEPRIAGWAMEGSSITAKDQSGAVLWQREFGFQVEHSAANPLHGSIADLDGDGSEELICIPIQPVVGGRGLYVFEGDGRLRFQHGVDRKVTFGDIGYTGFLAVRQWITPNDDGSSSIWLVANHTDQFPSVLQRLDANGSMLSEYWSNGHIETVASARMRGRHYLLVGGTNNEFKQASLAVLDYDTATGMAPATNTQYECVDCPARLPLHYFVFPSPELWRWRVTSMAVGPFGLKVSDTKEPITVSFDARAERALGYPDPIGWSAIYRLNSHFQFTRAEYGSDYLHAHAILQQLNNLDHAYTTAHEDELWPVLRWKDGTFAEESPLGRAQKK